MIIPSIDLMDGQAVQLIEGRVRSIEAGDPRPIARAFGRAGEVAVIDLDAALGRGDNSAVIRELLRLAPCRVGGGIRTVEAAMKWLDAGARSVILGTAATPEILSQLPRDRVIAALDTRGDRVVTEGWTRTTGDTVEARFDALSPYVAGFLVTFVEHEGHMQGLPMQRVEAIVRRAGDMPVTVAGGVAEVSEIAAADRLGADTQVGMALYSRRFDLADGLCAPLKSDRPDGLWPTVVTDEHDRALGLTYSNLDSVRASLDTGRATYYSRSRQKQWVKGATSGNVQDLLRVDIDCDRDALRFTVRQHGDGFCHLCRSTCFGDATGLPALVDRVTRRLADAPPGSYTRRLFDEPCLLRAKLAEEANELADAIESNDVAWETADVIYFAVVAMVRGNVRLADVERMLDERALRVSRHSGDAKPVLTEARS